MPLPLLAPALIAGGASLLGSVGQWIGGRQSQQRQQDFQERMSSTAYQRAMADMKAAGLNPMLAYQQGGASTPSGASFTPPNVGDAVQAGVSTALESKRLTSTMGLQTAEVKKIGQDIETSKSVARYNNALALQAGYSAKAIEMGLAEKALKSEGWRGVTDLLHKSGNYIDKLIDEITTVPETTLHPIGPRTPGAVFSEKDRKWKILDLKQR